MREHKPSDKEGCILSVIFVLLVLYVVIFVF